MWDALAYNDKGEVESVIGIKTTGGWKIGQMVSLITTPCKLVYTLIPGVDHVVMVASFLGKDHGTRSV